MANRTSSSRRPIKKGGMLIPALCNIIGTLLLIAVIATSIPLAIPTLLGYEIYNVTSGSMEPELPVGSVIYVEHVKPESIKEGEIIAFYSGGSVITHRAVENYLFEGKISTKGDANPRVDFNDVPYADVIGVVKYHFPYLGNYLMIYSHQLTKVYLIVLAFCGVMFNVLAGRMRAHSEEKFRVQVEQWERRQAARSRAEMEQIRKQSR
ncbi:MAG: signal peptidase I [Oscillospiraceae bacterium]|nr:signal peptidase I [Oscillospiraceae bacterium]